MRVTSGSINSCMCNIRGNKGLLIHRGTNLYSLTDKWMFAGVNGEMEKKHLCRHFINVLYGTRVVVLQHHICLCKEGVEEAAGLFMASVWIRLLLSSTDCYQTACCRRTSSRPSDCQQGLPGERHTTAAQGSVADSRDPSGQSFPLDMCRTVDVGAAVTHGSVYAAGARALHNSALSRGV